MIKDVKVIRCSKYEIVGYFAFWLLAYISITSIFTSSFLCFHPIHFQRLYGPVPLFGFRSAKRAFGRGRRISGTRWLENKRSDSKSGIHTHLPISDGNGRSTEMDVSHVKSMKDMSNEEIKHFLGFGGEAEIVDLFHIPEVNMNFTAIANDKHLSGILDAIQLRRPSELPCSADSRKKPHRSKDFDSAGSASIYLRTKQNPIHPDDSNRVDDRFPRAPQIYTFNSVQRLQKVLACAGVASRREAEKMVSERMRLIRYRS